MPPNPLRLVLLVALGAILLPDGLGAALPKQELSPQERSLTGQLESELARDDWVVAPASGGLVFDTPRERLWDEAMGAPAGGQR